MTTLVALSTKDAVVMGCDSLGTRTIRLVDPTKLIKFFDSEKSFDLKLGDDSKPLLKSFSDIYNESSPVPNEHMTHMTKLFPLSPLRVGVMITGITSIGVRTVKNLVEEFKEGEAKSIEHSDYSLKNVSEKLMEHIAIYYEKEFKEGDRPGLELIIAGYGNNKVSLPEIQRIKFPKKEIIVSMKEGNFGIVFGGQMKEIQRIVFGTDFGNRLKLAERHIESLRKYREKVNAFLKTQNTSCEIPELTKDEMDKLDIFAGEWNLEGFEANWGDFSEQNAIECVDFFVNIMIKSQQFSSGMPTVGGEVHIALINKNEFKFVSKEQYFHAGHYISKHTNLLGKE